MKIRDKLGSCLIFLVLGCISIEYLIIFVIVGKEFEIGY